jgi:FAD/FMN-containing dehydrogenase
MVTGRAGVTGPSRSGTLGAMAADPLLETLSGIVGPAHVLTDADVRAGYETDWTGRWRGVARAVVRPADTAEVAAVIVACADGDTPLVPQGGNTGLVGGSVPDDSGAAIVLSTVRLSDAPQVDPATAQLRAGAGVTLAAAQQAARDGGLELALDLAARDSATLGGLLACDAGGLRALRHGTARRQVIGTEAVLADGTVISRMSGLLKDTAGYDLGALLIGSEGTLGVVTAVRWSLAPRRDARAVALVGLPSIEQAAQLAGALRPRLPSLELCELMLADGMELALRYLRRDAPMDPTPVAVLLECAAASDPLDELAEALDEAGAAEHAIVAADSAGRDRLLTIRESHTDAIASVGVPVKFDVGVPLDGLAAFCDGVESAVQGAAPGARTIIFGHLGDGNLHVNVLGAAGGGAEEALDEAVLSLVARCGGTISAEHGIGRHKPAYLHLVRSDAELAAMRSIKRALDPAGILNPGVGLAPEPASA